ncbi:MAG: molybdenum cofactor guanylyltransferase [Spirochaetes bacterium]|nr:molybdenum cofactor guanylyltransferase [Spirochaetota bacterium]
MNPDGAATRAAGTPPIRDISAAVLAGGMSSRFGQNKAMYHHNGKPLIQHVTGVLSGIFGEISVIAGHVDGDYGSGYPVHPDLISGFGPLGGIHTALTLSRTEMTFIVASDMPLLNAGLIMHMLSLTAGYDIVAPCVGGFYETLHAVYSKRCLDPIMRLIGNNDRRVFAIYGEMRARVLGEDELRRFGDPAIMFKNVNSPGDL